MNDPLQQLFAAGARPNAFPPGSRYHGIDTTIHETASGDRIPYVQRRFIPPPSSYATIAEHTVVADERPDTIAGRYLGAPEAWWRICDANAVMRPEELTDTAGKKIRITLPSGIPGAPNA